MLLTTTMKLLGDIVGVSASQTSGYGAALANLGTYHK